MRHGFTVVLIFSCFGALFLICYAPALFMDRQFGFRDAGNYYYPLNKRVQAEWSAGRWPLWEPEENAGMPLLGNPTAAVLYPGKLVFAVLPYAWGARIYVMAHTALAFLSMFVLMRSWGTSPYGSGLSALSYAFGAPILFQTCNIIYLIGAAWLPLGIHAVDRWLRLGRRWGLCELVIVLSMQVLGGEPQAAYLLGLASLGYAFCLARNPARSQRGRADRAKPSLIERAGPPILMAIGLVVWCALTLTLAHWLPKLREPGKPPPPLRFMAWVPTIVNLAWALVAMGLLFHWRRRGRRSPLGMMWIGLAGSAGLSAALSAAQLFPVVEFMRQTSRADASLHETYRYALDPYQLVDLVWPGILGGSFRTNDYWRNIIETPGERPTLWIPSVYLGGLTVALAFRSLTLRSGPPWRVWLTVLAALMLLGSLGQYTSPIWMARALAVSPSTATLRNGLPDLGPLDPVDAANIRLDGYLHDADGSVYWWLSTLLPGFRQFRYPAKLFTFTAFAMAALAGFGWDRLCAGRGRGTATVFCTLLLLSSLTLALVIFQREPILASLRGFTSPTDFGPFQPPAAYRQIIRGLGHSMIVLALGLLLTLLARRHPRLAGSAALVLMTTDLAAANARYVLTVPESLFETRPEALQAIEDAERIDPSPGPFRVHRMQLWVPVNWSGSTSNDRILDVISWQRDTLLPKYGISFGLEYTQTSGVAQLADYERFFASHRVTVVDRQTAERLDVKLGESVVYYPRRAYDIWNTRYMIVAFADGGWRDPTRSYASFLFQSRQVYPDPDRFMGPNAAEQTKTWAETRDFRVIRNLTEYPRSWVVHAARATNPETDGAAGARNETLREILYAADPIWNTGTRRPYEPRNLAWVSATDLQEISRYLSGVMPAPSETVKVTYPSPHQATLEVTLDSPGLVILADVYYPGWTLAIDGKPAPIYRVNGLMRGAAVPSGHHRLIYTYSPWSFQVGWLVSIAGLAALVILGLACARWPVDSVVAGNTSLNSADNFIDDGRERPIDNRISVDRNH